MITNNDESNNEERQLVDQSVLLPDQPQQNFVLEAVNQFDYYHYPPQMDKAEIHRQAYYICPDQYVLDHYSKESCECCKKKFNRNPFTWWWGDIYEATVDEYGLAAPLYFTIIKFQLVIFIVVFCIYGIFFIQQSQRLCDTIPQLNCDADTDACRTCEFNETYGFVDIVNLQKFLDSDQAYHQYFQVAAFLIFLINLHLPFFYDLLITYIELQYWNRDPYHSQDENRTSIYVRHLEGKLPAEEIFSLIKQSMERNSNQIISSSAKLLINPEFEEIVYVHNTHHISELQKKRELILQDAVIVAQQLKELEMYKNITTYRDSEVKIYKTYTKILLQNKLSASLKSLTEVSQQIQKRIDPLTIDDINIDNPQKCKIDLNPLEFSNKAIIRFSDPALSQLILQNFYQPWYKRLMVKLNKVPHPKILNKLAVSKSLRINGLFWENLGFDSEQRVAIKLRSMIIMIIACAALMTAYEFIYLFQNDPDYQVQKETGRLSIGRKIMINVFNIAVPVITTVAILVVIINQKESRKNTFAHLERSFMHALIVVNYFLVTFVPFIFTFDYWDGTKASVAIYALEVLIQNKIIIKHIFHTVHIRYMGYVMRKRKLLKNCKEYFQGQLNSLMTPPTFPQRSRVCNAMYSLTVGLCLVYVCPLITMICFAFNIYIYVFDRYSITHLYTIDKRFTISLMRHQLKIYSLSFYPIKVYLFMRIFWGYGWLIYAGVPTCCVITFLSLMYKQQIIDFILRIFKVQRQENNKKQSESYSLNYYEYLKSIINYIQIQKLMNKIRQQRRLMEEVVKQFD